MFSIAWVNPEDGSVYSAQSANPLAAHRIASALIDAGVVEVVIRDPEGALYEVHQR